MAQASQFVAILGTDDGQVKDRALLWHRKLSEGTDEFANETIEGTAANAEEAGTILQQTLSALLTLPFFGGKKVVWLKNASFLGDSVTAKAAATTAGLEALTNFLQAGLPADLVFLLSATEVDGRRAFCKFLKKQATIEEYDKLDVSREGWEDQVEQLVLDKAKGFGLLFSADALSLFVARVGEATSQIANELLKIDLYLGPEQRNVTEDDIKTLVPTTRTGVIFEIGQALQKNDGPRAINLINQQLEHGESAVAIIRASIIPTVRNLFLTRLLLDNYKLNTHNFRQFESTIAQISEAAPLLPKKKDGSISAYPLFLAAQKAAQFPLARLRAGMEACALADRMLVTSGQEAKAVLHQLVVKLTTN